MRDAAIGKLTPVANGQPVPHAAEAAGESSPAAKFAGLFVHRLDQLKRIVAGMGFAAADAEDILQDVFVEASRRPGTFRSAEQAANWLVRVTVNRCLLEYRRRERFRRKVGQIAQQSSAAKALQPKPDEQAIRQEQVDAVRRAMRELDGLMLVPLILRYFCDMNSIQIGEILNTPPGTVRSRLREARLILAKRLLARGIEP